MKNKDIDFNFAKIGTMIADFIRKMGHYTFIILFVLIAGIYAFILYRINTLSNIQPNSSQISAQAPASLPHISQTTAAQLEQLQDNNVNTQTLFNQARSNPFAE
jgi:hypothetical protein